MKGFLFLIAIGMLLGQTPGPRAAAAGKARTLYRNKVAVLMWHHLDPVIKNGDIITPKQFSDQLDYLIQMGVHFISLQQFRVYEQGGEVPDNAALITFDDGYESFYKYAYPILKQRGIGGVSFVITGDMKPKAVVYIPHMKPAEIADMEKSDPLIEVQAHTDSLHYKLNRRTDALTGYLVKNGLKETKAQYAARISKDTQTCIETLKPLNSEPIDTFAYPYGLHTRTVENVLKLAGIQYAFTVHDGMVDRYSNKLELPRINGGSPSVTPKGLFRSIENEAVPLPLPFITMKMSA